MEGNYTEEYKYADVLNSINSFYSNKTAPISEFDFYLKGFQKHKDAWTVCIQLLREKEIELHVILIMLV